MTYKIWSEKAIKFQLLTDKQLFNGYKYLPWDWTPDLVIVCPHTLRISWLTSCAKEFALPLNLTELNDEGNWEEKI